MIFKKKKIKNYKDLGPPVNVKENFSNLIFITKIIKNLEYFVFFGTLLGLVRDNNLIKNDDDIDFYINIKERSKLIAILKKNSVNIDFNLSINKEKCFLQAYRVINNKIAVIDFYFYENSLDDLYIIEKWNFEGITNDPSKYLRTPKIFTHPIKKINIKSHKINFPSKPEYVCEFLYGKNWTIKLKKDFDYTVKVLDGKPAMLHLKKNFFGKKKIFIK